MKIIFATGHRPDKLFGGWTNWAVHYPELTLFCTEILKVEKPNVVISGMALGWDFAIAKAALSLNIPVHAYLPCENQGVKWRPADQQELKDLISKSSNVVTVSKNYTMSCMQERNMAMVNAGNLGLALWNGSAGGTGNCIKYATGKSKPVINVWDSYKEVFGSNCSWESKIK